MGNKSEESIARENALVNSASKLYPVLELECEGKRAFMLGGHEYDIDSINVKADGQTMLISDWVLEHCLQLPNGGIHLSAAAARQLTLTKTCVVSYGSKCVPKTPLLEWCQEMCRAKGVDVLESGSKVLVYWWDQLHSQQASRPMAQGHTWWPTSYNLEYAQFGVWFSARVQWYDEKQAALHVLYDYSGNEQPEHGKLILPLNYVHFGDAPPAFGTQAQLFPPPWKASDYETPAKEPAKQEKMQAHKATVKAPSTVTSVTAATACGSGNQVAGIAGGPKGKRRYGHMSSTDAGNEAGPPLKKAALQEQQKQPLFLSSQGAQPIKKKSSTRPLQQQEGQHQRSSNTQDRSAGGVTTADVGSLCCKLLEPDQGPQENHPREEAAEQRVSSNSPTTRQEGRQSLGQAHLVNESGKCARRSAVTNAGRGSIDGTILSRSDADRATKIKQRDHHHTDGQQPILGTVKGELAGPNPATGPTRRVCWPGATMEQIARLVSMPAAYPLHGPTCEANVRSLKEHLVDRSPGKLTQKVFTEVVTVGQQEPLGAQECGASGLVSTPSLAACFSSLRDSLDGLSRAMLP